MSPRYTYHLHVLDGSRWVKLFGEIAQGEGRGYLMCHREQPGPRLAMRLVRSDGHVLEEAAAKSEASIGMHAGSPRADQYVDAATRVLRMAHQVGARRCSPEALDLAIRRCQAAIDDVRAMSAGGEG